MANKVADISNIIMKELNKYSDAVASDVKECVKDVANDGTKELKKTSPGKTGQYARSWRKKTVKENSTSILVTIYADKGEYRKTHLLEKGHAKRNGGRVDGVPHISIAEQNVIDNYEKKIKERLKG